MSHMGYCGFSYILDLKAWSYALVTEQLKKAVLEGNILSATTNLEKY